MQHHLLEKKRVVFFLLFAVNIICGLLLASLWIAPSLIYDSFFPQVLLIGFAFFSSVSLTQALRKDDFITEQLVFSVFYTGLVILAAFHFFMLGSVIESQPAILIFYFFAMALLIGAILIPRILGTRGGRYIARSFLFRSMTFILITLLLILFFSEIALRTNYVRHNITGAHPEIVALEYRQPRQHLGMEDYSDYVETRTSDSDRLRVLVIGDSFTYGDGVFAKDRYASILENGVSDEIEVIVLAEKGASTVDELDLWRKYGEQTQPDVVIVGVVANDPDMELIPQRLNHHVLTRYFPRSQLAYYIDYRLFVNGWSHWHTAGLPYDVWEAELYSDSETQAAWAEVVRELYTELSTSDTDVYIYILPTPLDYADSDIRKTAEAKYMTLARIFQEAGFTQTRNLFPLYYERYNDRSYRELCAFPNDCHPNREVHAFYAEQMWNDIQNRR